MNLGERAAGLRLRLNAAREALRARAVSGPIGAAAFEFIAFGVKQAWACIFGGALLVLLLETHLWWPADAPIARYNALVIACVLLQVGLIASGLETWEEAKVIAAFHVVGTVMEIYKTHVGSWTYPEPSLLRIGGVPLFSGFMYAAVGSYLARVWRIFEFRFDRFPPLWAAGLLSAAIYVNFFTHHFTIDVRPALFVLTLVVFGPCVVWFRPDRAHRPMPLVVGFGLVALFIWLAENLGTLARAWVYPGQEHGCSPVSLSKFGAWYLLMIISFSLVALVHRVGREAAQADGAKSGDAGLGGQNVG
jgi:uncharacterized membrane protein YoaT (DUF817 family)